MCVWSMRVCMYVHTVAYMQRFGGHIWELALSLHSELRVELRLSGWCGRCFSAEPPCWPQWFAWEIWSYLRRSPDSCRLAFICFSQCSSSFCLHYHPDRICLDRLRHILASLAKAPSTTPMLPFPLCPQPCMAVLVSSQFWVELPSLWLWGCCHCSSGGLWLEAGTLLHSCEDLCLSFVVCNLTTVTLCFLYWPWWCLGPPSVLSLVL